MTPITLEWEDFLGWLMDRPEEAIVGIADTSIYCPIAQWLGATQGGKWSVGPRTYNRLDYFSFTPLPQWARQFIVTVDTRRTVHGWSHVTRDQALAALRGTAS